MNWVSRSADIFGMLVEESKKKGARKDALLVLHYFFLAASPTGINSAENPSHVLTGLFLNTLIVVMALSAGQLYTGIPACASA